jgi:hypothetical protein
MFVLRLSSNFQKYLTAKNMSFLDQSVDEYLQKKLIVSQFLTFAFANYSNQFVSLMTEKLEAKRVLQLPSTEPSPSVRVPWVNTLACQWRSEEEEEKVFFK